MKERIAQVSSKRTDEFSLSTESHNDNDPHEWWYHNDGTLALGSWL
jgi:hypothetical protein